MKKLTATATAAVAVVIVTASLLGASCSSDDGDSSASTTVSTVDPAGQVTSADGAGCTDPAGDIGSVAGQSVEVGTMTEPAGIDILSASATRSHETSTLDVKFETAGPVDMVPDASFVVSQGQPLLDLSYELRATREALGPWEIVYVSWPAAVETRTPLSVTPTIEGNTFTFSVPLDQLRPIANQLAFGASAVVADGDDKDEEPDVVFDDCTSLLSPQ